MRVAPERYWPSEIATASVADSGISRPPMCPSATSRIPKWNSGLPSRSCRFSWSWRPRVVQPNLSSR
jgi:hypothetical protein